MPSLRSVYRAPAPFAVEKGVSVVRASYKSSLGCTESPLGASDQSWGFQAGDLGVEPVGKRIHSLN